MQRFPAFRGFRLRQLFVWVAAALALDLAAATLFRQLAHSRTGPVATQTVVSGLPGADALAGVGYPAVAAFCHGPGERRGLDEITVERLRYAAELYHTGRAERVIGLGCHWNQPGYEPDAMRQALIEFGVAPQDALRDESSHDTLSNVEALAAIVQEAGLERVAVVSEPMHLLRIRRFWRLGAYEAALELRAFTPRQEQGFAAGLANAHHEALAWLAHGLLPRDSYRALMESLRR